MTRPSIRPLVAAALFTSMLFAAPATSLAVVAAPDNDNFADATVLAGTVTSDASTTDGATSQAGEPLLTDHFTGGISVWWKWTATADSAVMVDTCASVDDVDTVMGVYTGAAVDALTEIDWSDDVVGCGSGLQSRVTFNAVNGTTYYFAVDGYDDTAIGAVTLTLDATVEPPVPPANDDFAAATVIAGDSATVSGTNVNATGEVNDPAIGDGATVWWKWIPSTNMTVGIRTCGSNFDTVLGVYTGAFGSLNQVALNDDQGVCGDGIHSYVDVSVSAGTTYWILVDGYGAGDEGAITLQIGTSLTDIDGDGIANDSDCAPNDSTKPNRTGTDANCNGVVDANEDADGDTIANGVDCAPNDGTKPNRAGTDANCNGVVDANEDADGDTIANGIDCAPSDATKPNRNGTDANCDGVVDVVALVLTGGTASRTFIGGALGDRFNGGTGSETFRGLAGNDRAFGNRGNDKLFGGPGNDYNNGGLGADLVNGDAGNDTGIGGAGNDIINGGAGTDVGRGGPGNDRVTCGAGARDKAFGDAGNDWLNCYDRRGGDLIDGGLGTRDVCIGDRRDIFRRCEKIVKR